MPCVVRCVCCPDVMWWCVVCFGEWSGRKTSFGDMLLLIGEMCLLPVMCFVWMCSVWIWVRCVVTGFTLGDRRSYVCYEVNMICFIGVWIQGNGLQGKVSFEEK